MFENLLHQQRITAQLRRDIAGGCLPPALLFTGPPFSGKLTAALEAARALCCRNSGAWDCPCTACRAHRSLSHPRTVLAGSRDTGAEIAAAAEVLRRRGVDASRFLLVRSARKLLRRFDPVLWEGDERRIAPARPLMQRLSEVVDDFLPGKPLPSGDKLERSLDALADDCTALRKYLPALLPAAQVRRITAWAVHSAGSDHKTVIIDAAERMGEAARNALLKFLEEPPADTTALLLAERKSLLMPTILSRVRCMNFRRRNPAEEAEVLRRVYHEDQKRRGSLADYFRAWHSGPSERIKAAAAHFVSSARSGDAFAHADIAEIEDSSDLRVFLEALGEELRTRPPDTDSAAAFPALPATSTINTLQTPTADSPAHDKRRAEAAHLRDARFRVESLNMPIPLVLRGLFSALGESPPLKKPFGTRR